MGDYSDLANKLVENDKKNKDEHDLQITANKAQINSYKVAIAALCCAIIAIAISIVAIYISASK